ncbi:MSC_0622 family F1-like ATPase gamma subunit [Mycoplasma sp. 480]|uniref:MSC_0622 family F1-like ATPase gamma subunit n=1 Tax=Mycoplasma sp. 480 TaxID=3440155 RepID=UPI003F513B3B
MKSNNSNSLKVFENLYATTKISRLNTILKISNINKGFEEKVFSSINVKNILFSIENRYKLNSFFFKNSNKEKNNSKLWIYVSEKIELNYLNYNNINDQLLKKFNFKKDFLITIGVEAINFANKNKIIPIFQTENTNEQQIYELGKIISEIYGNKIVSEVIFILNSNRIKDNSITILPIDKFNFDLNNSTNFQQISFTNEHLIFPDIFNFIKNLFLIYLNSIVPALIYESSFFKLKQQLIHETRILKEIEKNIENIKIKTKELKRQNLTEEIVLLSQLPKENYEE